MSTKPELPSITQAGFKDLCNEIGELKKRVRILEDTVDDWRGNFWVAAVAAGSMFFILCLTFARLGTL
jgi:hypothetical protein